MGGKHNTSTTLNSEEVREQEGVVYGLEIARKLLLNEPIPSKLTDKTTIDLILCTLDKKIKKYCQPIIDHKRVQNSLSKISRLPPEILGYIFWLTSFPKGFKMRSLDFLPVCHYWYEVASCTPELWSFWGNTLQDWKRCHLRHPETPLDLVLDGSGQINAPVDVGVQDTLQDRASQDTIRLIHLRSKNRELLSFILLMLTVDQNEVRHSGVESFILCNEDCQPVDTFNFFANTHFPKLQYLDLTNCVISSLGVLVLQTNHLTTLALCLPNFPSTTTTTQLLLLLASNPSLQKIVFTKFFPHKDHNDCLQVPLLQLKEIVLDGGCNAVTAFLNKLAFPDILDCLKIVLERCTIEDISEAVGPYLQNHFQYHGRSQNGLAIYTCLIGGLSFQVGDGGGSHSPPLTPKDLVPFLAIIMDNPLSHDDQPHELLLGLIAHAPQEQIVHLQIDGDTRRCDNPIIMRNIYALLPNLRVLYLGWMFLSTAFPEPGEDGKGLFSSQSLQYLFLEHVFMGDDHWTPLTTFLPFIPHVSSIKQLDFLQIVSGTRMSPEVEEDIRSLVQQFELIYLS